MLVEESTASSSTVQNWLGWISTAIDSIRQNSITPELCELIDILTAACEINLMESFKVISRHIPMNWLRQLVVHKIIQSFTLLANKVGSTDKIGHLLEKLASVKALEIFTEKLRIETELISEKTMVEPAYIVKTLELLADTKCGDDVLNILMVLPLNQWTTHIREHYLLEYWPKSAVLQIMNLESKVSSLHEFLQIMFPDPASDNLRLFLDNCVNGIWILDADVIKELSVNQKSWKHILQTHTEKLRQRIRDASELVRIVQNDTRSRHVAKMCNSSLANRICSLLKKNKLTTSSFCHCERYIENWTSGDIRRWTEKIRSIEFNSRCAFVRDNMDEVIIVLCRGTQLSQVIKGHKPRETQILSLLIFLDAFFEEKGRIGQVSTGEGKTLIAGLLAVVQALCGKDVDIITSSTVLARQNVLDMKAFYNIFGLEVGTN